MLVHCPKPDFDERPVQASNALSHAEFELAVANREQAAAALKVAKLRNDMTLATSKKNSLRASWYVVESTPPDKVTEDASPVARQDSRATAPVELGLVFVVDHDPQVRDALRRLLEANGLRAETFADGEAFFAAYNRQGNACLLADTDLVDLGGLTLLLRLGATADPLPVIMITDSGDVALAVRAMQAGATDFIEKPIGGAELVASVFRALEGGRVASCKQAVRTDAMHHFDGLTVRQRQVMVMVLAGHPSKNIAADLGISQRTVENHRAAIMRKSGSKSLPALARLALAAEK